MTDTEEKPLAELEEEIKTVNEKRGDAAQGHGKDEEKEPARKPEKLSYRAATFGLTALVLVLRRPVAKALARSREKWAAKKAARAEAKAQKTAEKK